MKDKINSNDVVAESIAKFQEGIRLLSSKGYEVFSRWLTDEFDFYAEYMEFPCSMVVFNRFVELPSVPRGYALCHVTDERCSMLINRFADGLNPNEVLDLLQETAESVFDWACSL